MLWQHCAYHLVRFRHKKHLAWVKKTSCFGIKYHKQGWKCCDFLSKISVCFFCCQTNKAENCPEVSLKKVQLKNTAVPREKYPAVSRLTNVWKPSRISIHLHLLMWQSGHKHVTCIWYGAYYRNVKTSLNVLVVCRNINCKVHLFHIMSTW